jgi:hypothetical protein
VVSVTPRLRFCPGQRTPVPIVQETGWAPEPVWTHRLEIKEGVFKFVHPLSSTVSVDISRHGNKRHCNLKEFFLH